MATRAATRVDLPGREGDKVALYKWAGLLNTDVGSAVEINAFADKFFQIVGTAGAGLSVVPEGDVTEAGDQWCPLSKADGTAMSLSATPSGAQILEHPLKFRPRVAGGDGSTNVTAYLYVVGR
jgi:hypothetical protein